MGGKEGEIRMKLAYNIICYTDPNREDFENCFYHCLEYPKIKGKCYYVSWCWREASFKLLKLINSEVSKKGPEGIKIPVKGDIRDYVKNHLKGLRIEDLQKVEIDVEDIPNFYFKKGDTLRHTKTGNLYTVLDFAINANNSGPEHIEIVYCKKDEPDQVFVRSAVEMLEKLPGTLDSRFSFLKFEGKS